MAGENVADRLVVDIDKAPRETWRLRASGPSTTALP